MNYKKKIFYLFLKILSKTIHQKIFFHIENLCAALQGKGLNISISDEISSYKKLLNNKNIKIIFDVGANEGRYTDNLLKHFKKSNYYLFEPSKLNYKKLKKKFLNISNIKIINKALSNKNEKNYLYYEKQGSVLSSLFKRRLAHYDIKFNNKEMISLTRLDTFLNKLKFDTIIDYIKIDAEGSEFKIIQGMGKFINKIKLIQFEFGGTHIDSKTFFQDYWYYFKNHNFDLYRITINGPKLINAYTEANEIFKVTNYIAINKSL